AGVPVSIDTTKASVAAAALEAGAALVNDVSGGTADPDLLRVVADADAMLVVMHMRGNPRTMTAEAHYDDVVRDVGDELRARVGARGRTARRTRTGNAGGDGGMTTTTGLRGRWAQPGGDRRPGTSAGVEARFGGPEVVAA